MAAYGEHWYELLRDDLDDELIENMKLTMFFTPRAGFTSNRINFEIFPAAQYHIWARGDTDYMEHLGLGQWVSRDEDPDTGERLWNGTMVDGDRYFIKVKNGTSDVVDYYLFPDDVENAELGNPTLHQRAGLVGPVPYAVSPPTRPVAPPEPGVGPPEAISVETGTTQGTLQAGDEIWYKFRFSDPHNDTTPHHNFLMFLTNTPLDEIRARHAGLSIARHSLRATLHRQRHPESALDGGSGRRAHGGAGLDASGRPSSSATTASRRTLASRTAART